MTGGYETTEPRSGDAPAVRTPLQLLRDIPGEVSAHRWPAAVGAVLAAAWAVWVSGPGLATPAFVVLAAAGAVLGVIDARTHRLPNALLYPALVLTAGLFALAALAGGDGAALARALLGALVLGGLYLLLHLVNRSGLGLGDVKLALLLGLPAGWLGWTAVAMAAVVPFIVGGAVVLVLLLLRRVTRESVIAFGPHMLTGVALVLTWLRLL